MDCDLQRYSRITGYFSPTNSWNPGKQEEFKERKKYDIKPYLSNPYEQGVVEPLLEIK